MTAGRPTHYNDEVADKICELIATSTDSLTRICNDNDDLPDKATVHLWKIKHKEFYDKYLYAKRAQSELIAEECFDFAAEMPTYIDDDGCEKVDRGAVDWQKMNISLRQWHAGKLAPRVYGKLAEESKSETSELVEKLAEKMLKSK